MRLTLFISTKTEFFFFDTWLSKVVFDWPKAEDFFLKCRSAHPHVAFIYSQGVFEKILNLRLVKMNLAGTFAHAEAEYLAVLFHGSCFYFSLLCDKNLNCFQCLCEQSVLLFFLFI